MNVSPSRTAVRDRIEPDARSTNTRSRARPVAAAAGRVLRTSATVSSGGGDPERGDRPAVGRPEEGDDVARLAAVRDGARGLRRAMRSGPTGSVTAGPAFAGAMNASSVAARTEPDDGPAEDGDLVPVGAVTARRRPRRSGVSRAGHDVAAIAPVASSARARGSRRAPRRRSAAVEPSSPTSPRNDARPFAAGVDEQPVGARPGPVQRVRLAHDAHRRRAVGRSRRAARSRRARSSGTRACAVGRPVDVERAAQGRLVDDRRVVRRDAAGRGRRGLRRDGEARGRRCRSGSCRRQRSGSHPETTPGSGSGRPPGRGSRPIRRPRPSWSAVRPRRPSRGGWRWRRSRPRSERAPA